MEGKEGEGASPPVSEQPPLVPALVRLLRCDDLHHATLAFLEPVDVVTGLALLSKEVSSLVHLSFCSEEFWKRWLLKSFRHEDRQANRSRGYYKRLYLSLVEDGLVEHNLVSGGH